MCPGNTQGPALGPAQKVCFFVGAGAREWLVRFKGEFRSRRIPHLCDLRLYLTSLKKMLRPWACIHSSSGTYDSSPETLIITPKVCSVQKNICHCSNLLAGSVYRVLTGPLMCPFSANVVTQKAAPGVRCPSPEFPAELGDKVTRYVPPECTCQFLSATAKVKATGLMRFLSTKKSIPSVCFPCWLPRPHSGKGAECVIANLSFISFGCFCVTALPVPFSRLISCPSWKYSNYPEGASALERNDERAVKVYLSFKHPGELFTNLIQTQIKGLKSKIKTWSLCKNPTFLPRSTDLKNTPQHPPPRHQKVNEQTIEISYLAPNTTVGPNGPKADLEIF